LEAQLTSGPSEIEELIHNIEHLKDSEARENAIALVQALMEFHGTALERLMELIADKGESGFSIFESFAADEIVGSLLLLYGLHPLSLETRVRGALEKVRPYINSHGGSVELVEIVDGNVWVKLEGSCKTCPSSSMTLKLAIEDSIYAAAPDVVAVHAEGITTTDTETGFVQIGKPAASPKEMKDSWRDVTSLIGLNDNSIEFADVDGHSVLFCRLGDSLYAYGNACPGCSNKLSDASLKLTTLICNSCKQRFDVIRAGRGLDQPKLHLKPLPLLQENGRARIALPPLAIGHVPRAPA
jgi:Fe-S cluster biogenesis protein NfuA/nitrite reductase/ring-hydroxylating ferredoxin subunit